MAHSDERREVEERETYEALRERDRIWICCCLDMLEWPPRNFEVWRVHYGDSALLAASDLLPSCKAAFLENARLGAHYRFGGDLYPPLIRAGAFATQDGVCRSYASFKFLMERLFGGQSRPWLPSVYLAVSAHPSCNPINDSAEFEAAIGDRNEGWGVHEPIYFPSWKFS